VFDNNGKYSWTIPTNQTPGDDYKIKITYDTDTTIYDISDNNFTINVPPSVPTLSSPANGATGVSFTPTFVWSASTGTVPITYTLQVSTSNTFSSYVVNQSGITTTSYTLTTSLSNNTKYYWRVKASNVCGEATSSTFSFTTINLPSITLTYPNGGEILVVGSSIGNIYTIKWNYSGISSGSLNIDLYKGETLNKTIVSSCSITTGGYDWTIPTDQTPGDDYKIKNNLYYRYNNI